MATDAIQNPRTCFYLVRDKLYCIKLWCPDYIGIGIVNRTTDGALSQFYSKKWNGEIGGDIFSEKDQRWETKRFKKYQGWLGVTLKNGERAIIEGFHQISPAQQAGLQVGDVIIEIDNHSVKSTDELHKTIGRMPP